MAANNAVIPRASIRLKTMAVRSSSRVLISLGCTAPQNGQLPTQLIWPEPCAVTGKVQERQCQGVSRIAVLRDRLKQDHEAGPHQDRRRQEQPPVEKKWPKPALTFCWIAMTIICEGVSSSTTARATAARATALPSKSEAVRIGVANAIAARRF